MYCLEIIKSETFQNPPRIRGNDNRDSSACWSRGGVVIHSAPHRSTAFMHPDINPDAFFAAQYWLKQGQAAVNAFVPAIVGGQSSSWAEQAAIRALCPAWTIRRVPGCASAKGPGMWQAQRPSGNLSVIVGAYTLPHLHAEIQKADG